MDRKTLGRSVNLSVDLIPNGRPNRPGRFMRPTYVTIHNTSNAASGADASAHARFVTRTGFYVIEGKKHHVSWHYTVDDARAIKHLPVNEVGFHAGRGNSRSIGIEICMHKGIDQDAANDRAARLVAALMHDLGIPVSNVVTHENWTKKRCPTLLRGSFNSFVTKATAYRDAFVPSGTKDIETPDALITADEREAMRDFADDVETMGGDLLKGDDPHPGILKVDAADAQAGV